MALKRMKIIKLMIIVFLSVTILSSCAVQHQTALKKENVLQDGISSFQQQNYQAAFTQLYPLAVKGNSDAQYAIGYILYYGKTGIPDKNQGIIWITNSANQGNSLAEKALSIIYAQANFSPEKH